MLQLAVVRVRALLVHRHLISGFEFWVSGFGFRVSGFGFRVSGFGSRASGLGSRVSGLWFRVAGRGFRVLGSRFQVSGVPLKPHVPRYMGAFSNPNLSAYGWVQGYLNYKRRPPPLRTTVGP